MAFAALLLFLLTQRSRYCRWIVDLVQLSSCSGICPGVPAKTVLGYTANPLETTGLDVPSRRNWSTCATCVTCRCYLMFPVATKTAAKRKTREKSARIGREQWSVATTCKTTSFFRGCLVLASTVNLSPLLFAPKQLKWIHNGLCSLMGETNISEI